MTFLGEGSALVGLTSREKSRDCFGCITREIRRKYLVLVSSIELSQLRDTGSPVSSIEFRQLRDTGSPVSSIELSSIASNRFRQSGVWRFIQTRGDPGFSC